MASSRLAASGTGPPVTQAASTSANNGASVMPREPSAVNT